MAARFAVAPSTAVRIEGRYRTTGSVAPARQGRPGGSGKLGPHRRAIIDKVPTKPHITMPDLAASLEAQHGVTVDPSNLSKFLCTEGFTYKKTLLASEKERSDVKATQREWRERRQPFMRRPPARLIFIDESVPRRNGRSSA